MTERIATDTTLLPLAHLTAVDHSVAELRRSSAGADAGVRNVLALRGDPPGDPHGEWLRAPRRGWTTPRSWSGWSGPRATSASASPPSRRSTRARPTSTPTPSTSSPSAGPAPTSRSPRCSSDAEDYLRLRDRVAAHGCDVPVIAGIMPVTNVRRSSGWRSCPARRSRPTSPTELHAVADDPEAVRRSASSRDRAVRAAARRGRAGPPLHHPQPVDGDPGGLGGARPRRASGPRLR